MRRVMMLAFAAVCVGGAAQAQTLLDDLKGAAKGVVEQRVDDTYQEKRDQITGGKPRRDDRDYDRDRRDERDYDRDRDRRSRGDDRDYDRRDRRDDRDYDRRDRRDDRDTDRDRRDRRDDRDRRGRRDDRGRDWDGRDLPPGLSKRDRLPPGLARKLADDGTLPPGLARREVPESLEKTLPPLRGDESRVIIDDDVVVMERATGKVLDVLTGAAKGK